ncbi:MAG: fused MFS/spermidine synthase [Polyangiales bacterium]
MGRARISTAFLLSGAAALIFETLWFRQARLAFGNSVWACSLVLAAFMSGTACGSYLAARRGDRLRRPVRAFAALEVCVALSGVALVLALPRLGVWLAPVAVEQPLLRAAVRLALAFTLLLLPAAAMGASLPLLVRAVARTPTELGGALALLYGANTLGAVIGALATESVLLGWLGVSGSALFAAGLDLAAAAMAARMAAPQSASPRALPATPTRSGARALAATFLAGFALLALEVVWLRFMLLFLNDTSLAFATVLAVVLSGIAGGSLLAGAWLARTPRAHRHAGLVAYAACVLGVMGYGLYPFALQRWFQPDQDVSVIAALALPLVLPTALCSGALFVLLGAAVRDRARAQAAAVGRLALWNTLGAGLGSLLAGFVLLPVLGMERSLFGLLALYCAIGLLLQCKPGHGALGGYLGAFGTAAVLACFPFGDVRSVFIETSARRWMTPGDRVLRVLEGATATHVRVVHGLHGLPLFDQLATNAYSMSVDDFAARRYMKLFAILPLALHERVSRALVIGYGLGNTVEALLAAKEVARIDVVDSSPEILELSRLPRVRRIADPLRDPRVRVHLDDGRYHLQATSERFDLITAEPPPPMMAGVESLYSREYFELVRARLSDGGVASYWLPLMNIEAGAALAIVRAFCDAFDDCSLWHGSARNFMLLGTRNARGPVSEERFSAQWRDPQTRAELAAIGYELPAQLCALFIGDAPYLRELTANADPLVDDWPARMHAPGTLQQRDALIWAWRDTAAARERFADSELVARLFPVGVRMQGLRQFENQRLIDDLLFPEPTAARQIQVLHQVLSRTELRFPVLLLLRSDSDVERALSVAPTAQRELPVFARHRIAAALAARDFESALTLLQRSPDALPELPDLRDYVATALRESNRHAWPR